MQVREQEDQDVHSVNSVFVVPWEKVRAIKFENEEAMRHDKIGANSTSNKEYGQFVIEFTRIKTKLSVAAIGKTSEPVSPVKTPSKSKRFSIGDFSLGGLALGQALATASPTKESRKLAHKLMRF